MLASPSRGCHAGVLFEGLGEGGLLGIAESLGYLCYRKRAIGQKVLRSLHAASANVGAQGLACLDLKSGAQLGPAREEALGHLVDAHMSAFVERALNHRRCFFGNGYADACVCRLPRLLVGRARTGELRDHGLHDALHIDVSAYGAGAVLVNPAQRVADGRRRLLVPWLGKRLKDSRELGGIAVLQFVKISRQKEYRARVIEPPRKQRA